MGHEGAFLVTRRRGTFTPPEYKNLTPKLRAVLWTLILAELAVFFIA